MKPLKQHITESFINKSFINEGNTYVGIDFDDEEWEFNKFFKAKDYKKHISSEDKAHYDDDKVFQAFIKKCIKDNSDMCYATKADGFSDSTGVFKVIDDTEDFDPKYEEYELKVDED